MKTKEIKIENLVMASVAARLMAVAVLCVIALSGCQKENFEPEDLGKRTVDTVEVVDTVTAEDLDAMYNDRMRLSYNSFNFKDYQRRKDTSITLWYDLALSSLPYVSEVAIKYDYSDDIIYYIVDGLYIDRHPDYIMATCYGGVAVDNPNADITYYASKSPSYEQYSPCFNWSIGKAFVNITDEQAEQVMNIMKDDLYPHIDCTLVQMKTIKRTLGDVQETDNGYYLQSGAVREILEEMTNSMLRSRDEEEYYRDVYTPIYERYSALGRIVLDALAADGNYQIELHCCKFDPESNEYKYDVMYFAIGRYESGWQDDILSDYDYVDVWSIRKFN